MTNASYHGDVLDFPGQLHESSVTSMPKNEEQVKRASLGIVGVCALDGKVRSKPCRAILNRLISNGEFELVVFGNKTILDDEVKNWPICDFFISFHSYGFPLEKAIAYVKFRKPFCVNDTRMAKILWDRRICFRILDQINIPTPRRVEVNRDGGPHLTPEMAQHLKDETSVMLKQIFPPRKVELLDDGDTLSVDGILLRKPFVEKPVSGEDHNIYIYFPKSQGGGARKIFRNIGQRSCEWIDGPIIPRAISEPDGSYIYEQFIRVDNNDDIKVYTVGPVCQAEIRKSPALDGLIRRDTHNGKEFRHITDLTTDETAIASRIANAFGQRICAFDILRSEGKSFVNDINGFILMKDNEEYYDQGARILREMFIQEIERRDVGKFEF